MQALIDRAAQLEMAEAVVEMNEDQLEDLAHLLYELNPRAAVQLSKAIGFEDMEVKLQERHGCVI